MMKCAMHHITKLEFLSAFKIAHFQAIRLENIQASFRVAGLIPFNPEAVLSKLNIRFKTLIPPPMEAATWQSQILSNAAELGFQTQLIQDRS
jgi:hypothetical protein